MQKLKEILTGESKDLRVLDIGTGLGVFIEVLQESLPGDSSIVGIDTKQEALDKAAAKFQDKRIQFKCMHGEHLEFESGSIDVVSLSNTLHHLPNKEKVLSEIKKGTEAKGNCPYKRNNL
jgi:ubiquinone/menaquinone biosynthesis C-methylase UbiE